MMKKNGIFGSSLIIKNRFNSWSVKLVLRQKAENVCVEIFRNINKILE